MHQTPTTSHHALAAGLVLALAALAPGCASVSTGMAGTDAELPPLLPGRDSVIAWVPETEAATAGVAEAIAHIALTAAKRTTDAELCRGAWTFSGRLTPDVPARLAPAPAGAGGQRAWYLRIGWNPETEDCAADARTYALNLSRHLPSWMMVQSGNPLALYHRGKAIAGDRLDYALALRGASAPLSSY